MEANNYISKLYTERLTLRPYQSKDGKEIFNLLKDKEVAATTLLLPFPCNIDDAENILSDYINEQKLQKSMRWAITYSAGNEFIGGIRLVPNLSYNSAEVGFWIGKDYWRKGIAFETAARVIKFGFEVLKLNRIEAHAMQENTSSIKLLEKLGLKQEGYHPELVRKWGVYKDVLTFGMLQKQYIL